MYCPRCGHPNEEGMRFCEQCGEPLAEAVQAAQPPRMAYAAWGQEENAVVHALKKLALSPVCLTGIIAYTCRILFLLASSFTGNQLLNNLLSYASTMAALTGEGYELSQALYGMAPVLRGSIGIGTLIGLIPTILVAVGMWMTVAMAADKTGKPMKTSGLTMIRVIVIIQLIAISFLALIAELLLVLLAVAIGQEVSGAAPVLVAVILLVTILFIVDILYFVKLTGTIGTMCKTIRSQMPLDKISAYVAVVAIIGGVCSVLSLLTAGGILSALSAVCGAVTSIAFGVFLFQYKAQMRALMAGGHHPVAAAAVQTPVNMQEPAPAPVPQPAAPVVPAAQPAEPVFPAAQPAVPAGDPVGETSMLGQQPVAETTVLHEEPAPLPTMYLRRVRSNSMILIDRQQFRIGRDPGVADYIVTDNTAVGRQHADIVQRQGAFFVVDLNSTNHTYLNGNQIQPMQEYPLQNGDQLVLGDECFQVEISFQ